GSWRLGTRSTFPLLLAQHYPPLCNPVLSQRLPIRRRVRDGALRHIWRHSPEVLMTRSSLAVTAGRSGIRRSLRITMPVLCISILLAGGAAVIARAESPAPGATIVVTGTVRTAAGAPLAGAQVAQRGGPLSRPPHAITD